MQRDRAAPRLLQPGDEREQRRLATAARPDQRDELAAIDLQRDIAQDLERPAVCVAVAQRDGAHVEQRLASSRHTASSLRGRLLTKKRGRQRECQRPRMREALRRLPALALPPDQVPSVGGGLGHPLSLAFPKLPLRSDNLLSCLPIRVTQAGARCNQSGVLRHFSSCVRAWRSCADWRTPLVEGDLAVGSEAEAAVDWLAQG